MKKLAVVLLAMVFALGMAFTAQAANQVNVKTTSEPITKVGCEKNGSIQFTFDAGSMISSGYWWIIDLPLGATLCSTIDYVINAGAFNTYFGNVAVPNGTTVSMGHVKIKDIGADGAAGGISIAQNGWETLGGVNFKVYGASGSQRITVTAGFPGGAADDWNDPAGLHGSYGFSVLPDTEFTLTLFDQTIYAPGVTTWSFEDTDTGAAGTPPDGVYGNGFVSGGINPDWLEVKDNTLCVNAVNLTGNYVNVSLDSRDDWWNFTGDNEVAHVMAASVISLTACKGNTTGNVAIGAQGTCLFDYELATAYCTTPTFTGNQIVITNNNTWDDADYTIRYTITSPAAGVYFDFGTLPAAGVPAYAGDPCAGAAATVIAGSGWGMFLADGVTAVTSANGGSCVVAANQMARVIQNTFGKTWAPLIPLTGFSRFYVDMPNFVYDSSVVTNGTVVTVQVDLIKEPCGLIFSGTRDVATIVSSCAAAAPVIAPIVLPYFTNPSSQWWAGFAIANNSDTAGTVDIAMYEEDGDWAALNDVAMPARGSDGCLGVWLTSELVTLVTPDAGNAGQIGDARFWLVLTPDVAGMRAFVMMGDGTQGMGYIDGN